MVRIGKQLSLLLKFAIEENPPDSFATQERCVTKASQPAAVNSTPVLIWPSLFFLTLASVFIGQDTSFDGMIQSQPSAFHIDVDQIVIPIVVRDRSGAYVVDLDRGDFKVYEDDVEQRITFFAQVDFPISVALILDTSHSMEDQLSRIQEEAVRFVGLLRDADEVMVVSFDDTVRIENDFTVNRETIERAIRGTRCGKATCLCDAVGLTMQELQGKQGRKALVLFSDGVDWGSRTFRCDGNIESAQEDNVIIYPVFFDTLQDIERRTEEIGIKRKWYELHLKGEQYLGRLAGVSGGTVYRATGAETLGMAFSQIASELRSLYTLGYVSLNASRAGAFRRIRVEVASIPEVQIKHKKGYYSPSGENDAMPGPCAAGGN